MQTSKLIERCRVLETTRNQRNKVNNMCSEAKQNHYKEKLSDVRNQAQFYNIANKLLHRVNTTTLPTYECIV